MYFIRMNKQPDYEHCCVSDILFLHFRTDNNYKNFLTLSTQKLHNLACSLSTGRSHYLLMDKTSQVFVQSYDPDVTQDDSFDDANQKIKLS